MYSVGFMVLGYKMNLAFEMNNSFLHGFINLVCVFLALLVACL